MSPRPLSILAACGMLALAACHGDPHARAPERVRDDVLSGFISLARARNVYGVAFADGPVDDSLALDETETERLRGGVR